jgi:valacyclovir hydrolase
LSWFEHAGSRIYYEDEGAGESVLLLPGWAGSVEEFAELRPALASKYRVIAADLPGSGKSEPQPRGYPATYYHDDAASFLALLDHLDAAPAHLIGFSDGGEVALVMAELAPAKLRSIFAWGAAGTLAVADEVLDAMHNVVDAPIEPMQDFSEYMKATYGEANARAMAQSFVAAARAIMNKGGDVSRARAGEIACPVLLATGEHDFLATPAVVSELAAAIPKAEFNEVKGASHAIHHERHDWLVKTATGWLSRH